MDFVIARNPESSKGEEAITVFTAAPEENAERKRIRKLMLVKKKYGRAPQLVHHSLGVGGRVREQEVKFGSENAEED